MPLKTFFIRIVFCFILSILIGMERQYRQKNAGLRTNVLVSLGAFMFNWVSFSCNIADRTRIAAQVVSGIGFLGAGVIIHDNENKIKGLNTAATLWCVSAIGVLTSSGLLFEASISTLLVLLSNILLRSISLLVSNKIRNNKIVAFEISVKYLKKDKIQFNDYIFNKIESNKFKIINYEEKNNNKYINLRLDLLPLNNLSINKIINIICLQNDFFNINFSIKEYSNYSSDDE